MMEPYFEYFLFLVDWFPLVWERARHHLVFMQTALSANDSVCVVVVLGFWIPPKCWGYGVGKVWDRVWITIMVMEIYCKIGLCLLAHVAPCRWNVPCTCSNLGYSLLHWSNLAFIPPQRKYFFREEKYGWPFVRMVEMEFPHIVLICLFIDIYDSRFQRPSVQMICQRPVFQVQKAGLLVDNFYYN